MGPWPRVLSAPCFPRRPPHAPLPHLSAPGRPGPEDPLNQLRPDLRNPRIPSSFFTFPCTPRPLPSQKSANGPQTHCTPDSPGGVGAARAVGLARGPGHPAAAGPRRGIWDPPLALGSCTCSRLALGNCCPAAVGCHPRPRMAFPFDAKPPGWAGRVGDGVHRGLYVLRGAPRRFRK